MHVQRPQALEHLLPIIPASPQRWQPNASRLWHTPLCHLQPRRMRTDLHTQCVALRWQGLRCNGTWCGLPPSFRWHLGNIRSPSDVTLLTHSCDVLAILRPRASALACGHRTQSLLLVRYRYGTWTQNLSDDPPHACPAPDAPRLATRHDHLGGACPTGPDYLTSG